MGKHVMAKVIGGDDQQRGLCWVVSTQRSGVQKAVSPYRGMTQIWVRGDLFHVIIMMNDCV